MYSVGKVISAHFESGAAHDFPEKCITSFLRSNAPSLFCHDSEVLPGEQGCAGGQPPTIFTLFQDNKDIKKNITTEFT
jgi:hypothetical protein